MGMTPMTKPKPMTKPYTLEERAIEVHRRSSGLVRPLGVATIPDGPVGLRTASDDWVVIAAEDDPHLRCRKFVIPDAVAARLRELDRAKVAFDRLFIAHELPGGVLDQVDDTKLGPGELARIIPAAAPHPRTLETLSVCNRITRAAATALFLPLAAAGALPVAAGTLAAALDPALFGVVTESGTAAPGELAAWFLLAAWT